MDIEEYLDRKKDLEKKKELLESKEKLDKKKTEAKKKDIQIKRRREITRVEEPRDPHPRRHHHHDDRHYRHRDHPKGRDNIQWVFLGLTFFVALLVVGIYFVSVYVMPQKQTVEDEELSEVEELKKQLAELEKAMNESEEDFNESLSEESNETEENESAATGGPGPEFEIYIIDDWDDPESLGIFDEDGKVAGNLIELWGDGSSIMYKYRLVLENKEKSNIYCNVDELKEIDEDEDGEIDESDYDPTLYILKLKNGEEETMERSVFNKEGLIIIEYEANCYFCGNSRCDEDKLLSGESKKTAKLKVILHSTQFDNNNTNSS